MAQLVYFNFEGGGAGGGLPFDGGGNPLPAPPSAQPPPTPNNPPEPPPIPSPQPSHQPPQPQPIDWGALNEMTKSVRGDAEEWQSPEDIVKHFAKLTQTHQTTLKEQQKIVDQAQRLMPKGKYQQELMEFLADGDPDGIKAAHKYLDIFSKADYTAKDAKGKFHIADEAVLREAWSAKGLDENQIEQKLLQLTEDDKAFYAEPLRSTLNAQRDAKWQEYRNEYEKSIGAQKAEQLAQQQAMEERDRNFVNKIVEAAKKEEFKGVPLKGLYKRLEEAGGKLAGYIDEALVTGDKAAERVLDALIKDGKLGDDLAKQYAEGKEKLREAKARDAASNFRGQNNGQHAPPKTNPSAPTTMADLNLMVQQHMLAR